MQWLTMIRDHIITSFAIDRNDFELTPFNQHGGLGQAYDVLSEVAANDQDFNTLLNEINQQWTA
jgi:type III restriction protein res subunit